MNVAVGARSGAVTYRKRAHAPAPSRAAASCSDAGTPCSPARKTTIAYPVSFQTPTRASDGSAQRVSPSSETAGMPNAPSAPPTTPALPSSIHIQSNATAPQLTTYALKTLARTSAYVVSWVAVALLWMWMLDGNAGVVGRALRAFGM